MNPCQAILSTRKQGTYQNLYNIYFIYSLLILIVAPPGPEVWCCARRLAPCLFPTPGAWSIGVAAGLWQEELAGAGRLEVVGVSMMMAPVFSCFPPWDLGDLVWCQVAGALLVAAPRGLGVLVWRKVAGALFVAAPQDLGSWCGARWLTPCLLLLPGTLGPRCGARWLAPCLLPLLRTWSLGVAQGGWRLACCRPTGPGVLVGHKVAGALLVVAPGP